MILAALDCFDDRLVVLGERLLEVRFQPNNRRLYDRRFRDAAGIVNQRVAAVQFLVSGLPITVKQKSRG
ncbi:hypothetical protein V475_08750 [Sphingobium baderi LL03]|uniref:Uncharacterized protein n=1 Tax=Sphingobium baderi LL03 TaxID=1114964 RepID=T0GPJ4_9SPHN|nr:hypothetical protein [Sphingobium baderi]EQB01898.1 hypothetical protein L485_09700 [Sphingobium baderi LL03]KMS62314.1 hypothetical protein V475_08750 [Sphingobium baderi LL03]WRD76438.1 hypothetical protein QQ987_17110 [Sphingobium baderi]